jgi:hypothetical protein
MDRVDGGLSGAWMVRRATVANSVTVLVPIRYYSFCYNRICLSGFQGEPPASATGRTAGFKWIEACFQSVIGVH